MVYWFSWEGLGWIGFINYSYYDDRGKNMNMVHGRIAVMPDFRLITAKSL